MTSTMKYLAWRRRLFNSVGWEVVMASSITWSWNFIKTWYHRCGICTLMQIKIDSPFFVIEIQAQEDGKRTLL